MICRIYHSYGKAYTVKRHLAEDNSVICRLNEKVKVHTGPLQARNHRLEDLLLRSQLLPGPLRRSSKTEKRNLKSSKTNTETRDL